MQLYLVLVIVFDLPLRALNSRQRDFADQSSPLGSLDFLAATKYGSNTKLIIRMDAASFRLQSQHGLDDGWNQWKHFPSSAAESLLCWGSGDMYLEVPDQEFRKQRTPGVTVKGCFLLCKMALRQMYNSAICGCVFFLFFFVAFFNVVSKPTTALSVTFLPFACVKKKKC